MGPAHFSVGFAWGVASSHQNFGQSGCFGLLLSIQVRTMQQCNPCEGLKGHLIILLELLELVCFFNPATCLWVWLATDLLSSISRS